MDLADTISWMQVPSDDPLAHLLLEPNKLNVRSSNGFLARIVDMKSATPQRIYREDGDITFEIIDGMCPWNDGRWRLEISNGKAMIEKTDRRPEMELPIDTLSMILFGQISVTRAARMGRLKTFGKESLLKFDRLFQTDYRPFCADSF